MIVECAWCKAYLGTKDGEGTTSGICAPCQEVSLLEARSHGVLLTHERQALNHCIRCGVTASGTPLLLTRGAYVCFPCMRLHLPLQYYHLGLWFKNTRQVVGP